MSYWFECKVKYDRNAEDGAMHTVSELYLVDAHSFTDAEARIVEEVGGFARGEFEVTAVRKVKYSDVFFHKECDRWYKVKTNFITIDEKTAVEKRTASFQLVQAADFKDALEKFIACFGGTLADYEIASITETMIMDVFGANIAETEADKAAKKK